MTRGTQLLAGIRYSTVHADLDFETYSEAGYYFGDDGKWHSEGTAQKSGLSAVGAAVYAQHPSTEILCMAYDLKDGSGKKLWTPTMPTPPFDLLQFIESGGIIESHNSGFEYLIWHHVLHERFGWPDLPITQQRCSMAKAQAFSYPGALGDIAKAIGSTEQKDKDGTRLIRKFCIPRQPTKKDLRTRIRPEDDPEDFAKLCAYCTQDITAESSISEIIPDLIPEEEEFWLNTCKSNNLGVEVRPHEVNACISILEQAYVKYNQELRVITNGEVSEASKDQQLVKWCNSQGLAIDSVRAEVVKSLLNRPIPLPPQVHRALEIRYLVISAGVKKVFAMRRQADRRNRLCGMFRYHGARTGRDTGADVQPQNLVKKGPKIQWCTQCNKPFGAQVTDYCPHCGAAVCLFAEKRDDGDWSWEAVDHALEVIGYRSLSMVEHIFGDALLTISGCIRGLFVPAQGKDFICSDYSAIEAVVAATLSGEQWRIDHFNTPNPDIYLYSASKITGTTPEEYAEYHRVNGKKHPDRSKIGKIAELALGYGGWIGSWRNFDKSGNFSDEEVKNLILMWRDASPALVEMWGGQPSYRRNEYYGLEGMATLAIMNPGEVYSYRSISFGVTNDVLYCRLPSGRTLTYHQPRLTPSDRKKGTMRITFMGWNSDTTKGPKGWHRLDTYGPRLFENVTQAVARDIMRDATNRAERRGYPVVLRVHDELVAEVPENYGSIEDFEAIMAEMPEWATGWPVRAAGGWRGKRYRKD